MSLYWTKLLILSQKLAGCWPGPVVGVSQSDLLRLSTAIQWVCGERNRVQQVFGWLPVYNSVSHCLKVGYRGTLPWHLAGDLRVWVRILTPLAILDTSLSKNSQKSRDGPWPDPTRAYFWPAVNKRPTRLRPGYFRPDPKQLFLTRRERIWKFDIFWRNFQNSNPNHKWLTLPDPSHKKLTRPDPGQKFLTRNHHYKKTDTSSQD